jgi:hypothetical protein
MGCDDFGAGTRIYTVFSGDLSAKWQVAICQKALGLHVMLDVMTQNNKKWDSLMAKKTGVVDLKTRMVGNILQQINQHFLSLMESSGMAIIDAVAIPKHRDLIDKAMEQHGLMLINNRCKYMAVHDIECFDAIVIVPGSECNMVKPILKRWLTFVGTKEEDNMNGQWRLAWAGLEASEPKCNGESMWHVMGFSETLPQAINDLLAVMNKIRIKNYALMMHAK